MEDSIEKRKNSEEAKYKLDAEMLFKAKARRNKLLGLWAAERMGMSQSEAEAYAGEVVRADLAEPGIEDVVRKVQHDLSYIRNKGILHDFKLLVQTVSIISTGHGAR